MSLYEPYLIIFTTYSYTCLYACIRTHFLINFFIHNIMSNGISHEVDYVIGSKRSIGLGTDTRFKVTITALLLTNNKETLMNYVRAMNIILITVFNFASCTT